MELNGFYNMDCMAGLAEVPDQYFDLAIVDPPYGAGFTAGGGCKGWFEKYHPAENESDEKQDTWSDPTRFGNVGGRFERYKSNGVIEWDVAPPPEYFTELFRVSRNQIIWGGNYFQLPPCRCFIVWRKLTISENFTMAMAEYAWTSYNDNAKVVEYAPQGKKDDPRFHPTQKPIELYQWCLSNYAKPGYKILDTHVGSGSSLIACENMGFKYLGFEINTHYYNLAQKRIEEHRAQMRWLT